MKMIFGQPAGLWLVQYLLKSGVKTSVKGQYDFCHLPFDFFFANLKSGRLMSLLMYTMYVF